MEITFTTKKESKAAQQEAFLKLSGGERVIRFIQLSKKNTDDVSVKYPC
jgi:hypothetical protein